jgi:hypothetical protein
MTPVQGTSRLLLPAATSASTFTSRGVTRHAGPGGGTGQLLHPGEVVCRTQLPEDPGSGVELHRRGVGIAQGPARQPDQHPHPGRLVRAV